MYCTCPSFLEKKRGEFEWWWFRIDIIRNLERGIN